MSTTIERIVISRAYDLIKDRKGWTRHAEARAGNGREVEVCSPKAKRFCAIGALRRAAFDVTGSEETAERIGDGLERLITERFLGSGDTLPMVNDCEGHAAILAVFERAKAEL
jgi:hypothetical protein